MCILKEFHKGEISGFGLIIDLEQSKVRLLSWIRHINKSPMDERSKCKKKAYIKTEVKSL